MAMAKAVAVTSLPDCDLCVAQVESGKRPKNNVWQAQYDGATRMGPWANMCQAHFQEVGVGLGTGRGQRLVLTG